MSENDDQQGDGEGAAKKEKKKADLEDYLSSPRKKRKSHVVMAYGTHLNPDLPTGIQGFLKRNFSAYALSYPRTPEELTRQFSKVIKLLIYDDEFTDIDQGLQLLRLLKQKKHKTPVPILFLTASPGELIAKYNEHLLPFHESDEYINYDKVPLNHVLSKINGGLTSLNRRRSRRYKVNVPVTFESLTTGVRQPGRLLDLSMHGALLRSDDEKSVFKEAEQLKIFIPIGQLMRATHGDFLRLSCKVRRVQISGNHAGVSFEYVTDDQISVLTRYLTNMVNVQVARQARAGRSRGASR